MTNFQTARFHVTLPRSGIFALPDAADVAIECRSGSVWVTLDNDPRDIVLAPGQRFDGKTHRRALVSALESSCIAVSALQPLDLPWPAPATRAVPVAAPSRWLDAARGLSAA